MTPERPKGTQRGTDPERNGRRDVGEKKIRLLRVNILCTGTQIRINGVEKY